MPNTPASWIAGGNIFPSRFIKADATADHTALQADANARIVGISHDSTNKPPIPDVTSQHVAESGQQFRSFGEGDQCLLELGGTVAAADLLKADADGKGVAIATTGTTIQNVGARAKVAGSAGHKIPVDIVIYSERPALA